MTSRYEWFSRRRNYALSKNCSGIIPAINHPLRNIKESQILPPSTIISTYSGPISQSSRSSSTNSLATSKSHVSDKEPKFVDPLGVTLAAENSESSLTADILENNFSASKFVSPNSVHTSKRRENDNGAVTENGVIANSLKMNHGDHMDDENLHAMLDGFEPWSAKRALILQKYTTNEKLSIITSFLPGGIPLKTQVTITDKVKHRLEQLDALDNSERHHFDLNQKEYVEKINELNRELTKAWHNDQRVQSIKIVIQCAKLLSNTSAAPQFYPSQFVLITDVLDTFGRLVFARLFSKANSDSNGAIITKTRINHRLVPESAKETCRNWFYKIASIRELLPRFYVETAILLSTRFICDEQTRRNTLVRLAESIRGFADPLVAIYARAYLCRIGMSLEPDFKDYVWRCFHDTLTNYDASVGKSKRPDLYSPAFDWILQCLTYNSSSFDLGPIVEYCRQKKSSLLLTSCLKSTSPQLLILGVESSLEWIRIIRICRQQKATKDADDNSGGEQLGEAIRLLGKAAIVCEPRPEEKIKLLNEAWKLFMIHPHLEFYLSCAEVWFEFACRQFGPSEVNTLLNDIVSRCVSCEENEDTERGVGDLLFQMLEKLVTFLLPSHSARVLFDNMPAFVSFLDLLRLDDFRHREACEKIIGSFCEFMPVAGSDDASLGNHMLGLCRILHDSGLNEAASAIDDERRRIGHLICRTLDRFSFYGDRYQSQDGAEKELEFLVECRGYFCNLDLVQAYVVQRLNNLALAVCGGGAVRTRKTAAFIRACIANVFVTIPSIGGDHFIRLKLYLQSASVALMNNCLVQADALLKACISLILDVPPLVKISQYKQKSTELSLVEFVSELMSLLLLVPDDTGDVAEDGNGDTTYLYLFQGLLNALRKYPWTESGDGKFALLLQGLRFLTVCAQQEFPYRIDLIESNDSLYGGDPRFLNAVGRLSNVLVQEMLDYLKKLDSPQVKRRQAMLCLDFVECILCCGDLEQETVRLLTVNLWNLAKKTVVATASSDRDLKKKTEKILCWIKAEVSKRKSPDGWTILDEKF